MDLNFFVGIRIQSIYFRPELCVSDLFLDIGYTYVRIHISRLHEFVIQAYKILIVYLNCMGHHFI